MGYKQVKDQERKPKGSELPRLLLSPVGWQISFLGDQRIKVFFHSFFCFFPKMKPYTTKLSSAQHYSALNSVIVLVILS